MPNVPAAWSEFASTPRQLRVYLTLVVAAALVLPFVLQRSLDAEVPLWLTAGALVLVSVLNVEISRWLSGGLERTHQPHKALSAWAFASALLLPTPWLLVLVPLTYAHARWRGLRLPLWKWIGSGCYLVLCGVAAAAVRTAILGDETNWMDGGGGRGLVAMLAAAATFLAAETVLFSGSALLNNPDDEVWLRRTLRSPSFYGTEAGVLLIGGLLAAVWTGGPWYTLIFVPIYALVQRAALHEPLRERAAVAARLAQKNRELESANQFKIDLMGMLGHEIGNPLTAVHGYATLGGQALGRADTAFAQNAFEIVDRNALQIKAVLDDIMALVRSELGVLTATPVECLLEPRLKSAASGQPPGQQPDLECSDGLTALVQPGHLDQILSNLLSNAQKYAGGATRLEARTTGNGHIEVSVTDDGPGVPQSLWPHLFERFSRDVASAREVRGSGLGLFITRELARANGGDVSYQQPEAGGSVFVVTLPAAGS